MGHSVIEAGYFFDPGAGLPPFSSFEAAAAFWVARLVAAECVPGSGLQLPFVPGFLPGVGSNPGQQGLPLLADFFAAFFADFFAVVITMLEWADAAMGSFAFNYFMGVVVSS